MDSPNKSKWYTNAFLDTLLIVVFTVLPTIFALFRIFFINIGTTEDLYKSGEFLLYSVSFSGSAYIAFNQFKIRQPSFNLYSSSTLIMCLLASIAYTTLAKAEYINTYNLLIASTIALILSLTLFYYSQLILNRKSPDVNETRSSEIQTIQDSIK